MQKHTLVGLLAIMFHLFHAGNRPIDAHGRADDCSDRWVGCLKLVPGKTTWQQAVTANRVHASNPSSSDGIKALGVIEALLGPARLRVASPLVSTLGLKLLS